MLPMTQAGGGEPTLVLMHFFGSSRREWTESMAILAPGYRCIALDLPGFGEAADRTGFSVEEMAQSVEATLRSLKLDRIVLVGHSMSGKIALAIASRNLVPLRSLVLISPSPPSSEPMKQEDRTKMLGMLRGRKDAIAYLDGITAKPLAGVVRERAIEDFIGSSPAAWEAWLETGTREDWTERVWRMKLPALVITGADDPALPAAVQEQTTMFHLMRARLEVIPDCGHVPPMEAPAALAALISDFAALEPTTD